MKVLLIDPSVDVHEIVCIALETEGMDVITVTTPTEGLASARNAALDVILLDYTAGDADGIDTMTLMRSQRSVAHVPVIFLSSRSEPIEVAQMLAAGATGYIGKPLEPRRLADQIRNILSGNDTIALAPTRKESIVDRDLVASLREYDSTREGFFSNLVREFLEETRGHVRAIEEGVESLGRHEIRDRARLVSQSAANLGASRLSAEAHRLETMFQHDSRRPEDVREGLQRLKELESLTRRAFEEMLES